MSNYNRCVFSFFLIFAALSITGCKDKMGGTYPMSVRVTHGGTPLGGATVTLYQTGSGNTAVGITNADGFAAVKSTEGGWEGVFPGEYTVTIKKTEYSTSSTPPPGTEVSRSSGGEDNSFSIRRELLPEKYGSVKTSGLTVIQEKKKGTFEFDVPKNP